MSYDAHADVMSRAVSPPMAINNPKAPSAYSIALTGQNLKTHRSTVQVCTRCLIARIIYSWAFETIWSDTPIRYYA